MLEGGHAAVQADEDVVGASQVRELEKRVRDLERMLGKKTMEAEILKEALDLARQKKDLAVAVVEQPRGRFPMSAIAGTLAYPGRTLIDRTSKRPSRVGPIARPVALVAELRPVIDQRPTYGYRRVTALLTGRGAKMAGPWSTQARPQSDAAERTDPSKDSSAAHPHPRRRRCCLRSNIRWCSDHLEIHARDGEVVRIVSVFDACDREIIAWSAVANADISGEMVCDLMIAATIPCRRTRDRQNTLLHGSVFQNSMAGSEKIGWKITVPFAVPAE